MIETEGKRTVRENSPDSAKQSPRGFLYNPPVNTAGPQAVPGPKQLTGATRWHWPSSEQESLCSGPPLGLRVGKPATSVPFIYIDDPRWHLH